MRPMVMKDALVEAVTFSRGWSVWPWTDIALASFGVPKLSAVLRA
jgi:hypothetical protein